MLREQEGLISMPCWGQICSELDLRLSSGIEKYSEILLFVLFPGWVEVQTPYRRICSLLPDVTGHFTKFPVQFLDQTGSRGTSRWAPPVVSLNWLFEGPLALPSDRAVHSAFAVELLVSRNCEPCIGSCHISFTFSSRFDAPGISQELLAPMAFYSQRPEH